MEIDYSGIDKQMLKYRKAQNLMKYINTANLYTKFLQLDGNKATGIDKVTKEDYSQNLNENLNKLVDRMKTFSYRPQAVRRVYIPKSNGKLRPLGIPAFEDKLVQGIMTDELNVIYEHLFLDCSYGFRPNRDCHKAIKQIDNCIMRHKTNYIVEADIKGFFDNVNHKWLIKFLEHDIQDKNFIRYVVRFLKSGIMEDLKYYESDKGTPQGGLISPVLANVYLHYVLDLWFALYVKVKCNGYCELVRYADDFVVCFEKEDEAKWFYQELMERLAKFDLEIEPTKTRIFPFGKNSKTKDNFDFLGFNIYNGTTRNGYYAVMYRTSKKKSKLKRVNIKEYLKEHRTIEPKGLIKHLNRVLIGYYNYYGISFNVKWLQDIYCYVVEQLKKWLSRRSQRGEITWNKMYAILKYEPLVRPRITFQLW